jgi:hypothetical protein
LPSLQNETKISKNSKENEAFDLMYILVTNIRPLKAPANLIPMPAKIILVSTLSQYYFYQTLLKVVL